MLIFFTLAFLFAGTTLATRLHTRGQADLASEWYERGRSALEAGLPGEAIEDLRTALVYSRDNRLYRFRLAEALEAAGRPREAQAYLLQLWETEPGSGPINLHLGRLAAQSGDAQAAVRYYQSAINGVWEQDPEEERLRVRFELVDFLLSRRFRDAAQAELLALAGDLPDDAGLHVRVGDQFLSSGASEPAAEMFQRALSLDPPNANAFAGLGRIAFSKGDYLAAARYLSDARATVPGREDLAELLEISNLAVGIDPFDRRLNARARRERVIRAFELARERLMGCLPVGPLEQGVTAREDDMSYLLEETRKIETSVTDRGLRQDPDLIDTAMDLVFAIEEAAARTCGTPAGLDRALLLIGRRAEGGPS